MNIYQIEGLDPDLQRQPAASPPWPRQNLPDQPCSLGRQGRNFTGHWHRRTNRNIESPTMTRKCIHCGHDFEPLPHVPRQAFCSHPACQRARKREWQQDKLHTDPDYRQNQRAAQRAWQERNRDYWQEYRASHHDCREASCANGGIGLHKPPPGKMDAWALQPGLYELCAYGPSPEIPGISWLVEIIPIRKTPRAGWTCKERT